MEVSTILTAIIMNLSLCDSLPIDRNEMCVDDMMGLVDVCDTKECVDNSASMIYKHYFYMD